MLSYSGLVGLSLPDRTLVELRGRFGSKFVGLDENERLLLATAEIEGFVTNGRMQQICRLHPRDITLLLKKLEDDGFLAHDGQGRGTTYRIAGSEAVDMADSVDLSDPARSEHLGGSSAALGGSPKPLGGSSTHLGGSSTHLAGSSTHLEGRSTQSDGEDYDPCVDPRLIGIAEDVSSRGKADGELVRKTVLALCGGRFLSIQQLGRLLKRSPVGLRDRFVKPMTIEGLLERRFPQQPNHEQQAYRTR